MDKIDEIIDSLHLKISKNRISQREIHRRSGINQDMIRKVLDGEGKVEDLKKIIVEVDKIIEEKKAPQ